MIYILSWTTKKHQKTLSRLLHSKLKKNQGLFKDLQRNLRLFNEKWNSRTSPKIQGLFKTVQALFYDLSDSRVILLNPLSPSIHIQILQTDFYTFP